MNGIGFQMTDSTALDEAIEGIADSYWRIMHIAVAARDVDTIFDTAISLKAIEETRINMKKRIESGV